MQPFLIDFRQAMRSLRKAPGLAAIAIGSLALGIGANVTVFSVVREMILDDLSARSPDRLVRVEGALVSYAQYRQLRTTAAFEGFAFYRSFGDQVWHTGNRSEIVWRLTTSADFFDVLGIHAYAGRLYSSVDEGRELAVASYGFWRKRLRGDPNAVGQPVQLAGRLYTLVGVLPRDYRSIYGHGVSPELYLSDPGNTDPHDRLYGLVGRLHGGASLAQTRQVFAAAVERLKGPETPRQIVELRPMSGLRANAAKGGDDRLFLLFFMTLFGVAGMLALIGCSNVAGLLMVRTLNRQRELAIRKALGATRIQILRPLIAEGLVLVLCGAGLGLVLDAFLRDRLSGLRWPSAYGIPFEFHFQSDYGLFLYAGVTALAALLLSSVLPALRGADVDLALAMKQGEPSFSVRHWDMRNGFLILQVALSMVLLTVSSLFGRSLLHLAEGGPGFDTAHTLIAAIHPLPGRYEGERSWDLRRQVLRQIQSVPGVEAVTSAGTLPLMGEVPGDLLRWQGDRLSVLHKVSMMGVGENYFATLNIPILRGRDFRMDDRGRTPMPVIVNRTLARDVFAGQDPIGHHLLLGREKETVVEIVGVAADFKMRTLGEADTPAVFRPDFNAQLLVRVAGNPALWVEPLREALGKVDGTAALDVRPLHDAVGGAMFPMRVATGFLVSLSSLGLALSLIGLYGSVSYAVGRRTREFGIRAALGASRQRIIWTALRDGVAVLACGAGAGTPLALLLVRPLVDLFPAGFNPWAPASLLGIIFLLFATGAVAIWVPALRAVRVDPSAALRQE
ncbi:ABC transporter permease [uncultured Paludibaculum sp.]|uniref:ABC transporter permease n=1 Tax=uncultured Paludibaculum sp. TaxID=1765020 RepID=UPI002AAAF87F|nr:FtsX-like permease family protein [uncultured Paludibaculum sp.]